MSNKLDSAAPDSAPDFSVVAIGASAGGLEAFEAFLRACPDDTGMAFVFISHLAPDHESLLAEILQRATRMPVTEATQQLAVRPDHVYIIPPNQEMTIRQRQLQLAPPQLAHAQRMPIDTFLLSLADDLAQRSVAIILSGTANDGTLGLQAVLAAGGVSLVQDPASAKFDGMPQSAIASGAASHVLPVARMPAMLQQLSKQATLPQHLLGKAVHHSSADIDQVLLQLRSVTGHDFSRYKKSTIGRRIARRMELHQIEQATLYARYLKEHPDEAKLLFNELLINVTCFFRDAEAFLTLKNTILPQLLADKPSDSVFRVWVAGCSTGEEAYSIAMLLAELQDERSAQHQPALPIQIYATDLDDDAILTARAGRYPASIASDVSAPRLARFFIKEESGYRVSKTLRDMVIFAVQSVIKDPPFTRLDLLSCRNLLIYLEAEQQKRLIPIFHYALNRGGVLFLSSSENIASTQNLFTALDRKWKFYRAVQGVVSVPYPAPHFTTPVTERQHKLQDKVLKNMFTETNLGELARSTLLQAYAPASVITDSIGNILYVYGDTGNFLRPAPGQASLNVVDMAREGLEHKLREIFATAATQLPDSAAQEVAIKTSHGFLRASLRVRQLPAQTVIAQADKDSQVLLLSFQELPDLPSAGPTGLAGTADAQSASTASAARITYLERELAYAKENERVTVEKHQLFNLELKATNEDLQSTNEELQSSNEELMTSKEELQSLNEEMININSELNSKIEQLSDMQNDMKNLLDSIDTGTVFLDHQLQIRRFTPQALRVFRLMPSDIGRPLADIKSKLAGDDLQPDLQQVLDTLIPIEREVRALDGEWYLARMQPYRTLDNVIAGVVLTLTAVTRFKRTSEAAQLAQELAEGIVNTVREPLLVLDAALQVVSAGRAFYDYFGVSEADTVGRKIYDLGAGQWNIPSLRQLLEDILPQDHVFDGYAVEHDFPGIGRRRLILNARRIVTVGGQVRLILLAMVGIETPDP